MCAVKGVVRCTRCTSRVYAICKLEHMLFVMRVKVAYISKTLPLIGEHASPLTEFVGWPTHVTINKTFLCLTIPG